MRADYLSLDNFVDLAIYTAAFVFVWDLSIPYETDGCHDKDKVIQNLIKTIL